MINWFFICNYIQKKPRQVNPHFLATKYVFSEYGIANSNKFAYMLFELCLNAVKMSRNIPVSRSSLIRFQAWAAFLKVFLNNSFRPSIVLVSLRNS